MNPNTCSFRGIVLLLLFAPAMATAQDSLTPAKQMWRQLFSKPDSTSISSFSGQMVTYTDSSFQQKLRQLLSVPDSNYLSQHFAMPRFAAAPVVSKPFIKWGGGYLSYNWTYRTGSDSSLIDNNVSQHLVTGSFTAVIAGMLPVRVSYYERHSNSPYFKDYRDITIDLDVQQYRRMKMQRSINELKKNNAASMDPFLPTLLQAIQGKLKGIGSMLGDRVMLNSLIQAKETLIRSDFPDTSAHYIDSVRSRAQGFINLYDSLQSLQARYTHINDSLAHQLDSLQANARQIEQWLNGKNVSPADLKRFSSLAAKNDNTHDNIDRLNTGLKRLSIGRTYPYYSSLTVQYINVNGIHMEYAGRHYYITATAGLVDFRIRDFLYSQQQPPRQYLFASRIGYGSPAANHIALTYFRGRKQLLGGDLQQGAAAIQGVSLGAQYLLRKNIRVYAEIAQSGIPYALGGNNKATPAIDFSDHTQRACAAGFSASFPRTQTVAEGYYQHNGLNYQSFNSFQYNAAAGTWSFRLQQAFWKKQLDFQASIRKNDFVNPLVLQRYNANTVFKTFTLTLHKAGWPVLMAGYMPASQYTAVAGRVYENHYQALTGTVTHQYRIGVTRASSLFSFSRFYNDKRDSGLLYYNAANTFLSQAFLFTRFTATMNISFTNNGGHRLLVMEEAFSVPLLNMLTAGFGIKVNNLDKLSNRIGFSGKLKTTWKRVGEFNLWMEQSYLPGLQQAFYRYTYYNIGFIRYFN